MSTDQGFILFPRAHRNHPLFQEPDKLGAWLWMMSSAAHTAREVSVSGQLVPLEPGQLTFSIRFLAKKWGWSEKKVMRFLAALERVRLVTTGTIAGATTGQTIINISNWQEIQRRSSSATTAATTATTTPTITAATTKKKQLKQLEKNTLSGDGFERWYAVYPRKQQRKFAERAYVKVIREGRISEADMLIKTEAFAALWARRPEDQRKYIPLPATWLNAGSYADEPDGPAAKVATPPAGPETFDDARWRRNLNVLHMTQQWNGSWGPPPGELGCLVPFRLIGGPQEGPLGAAVATPLRHAEQPDEPRCRIK